MRFREILASEASKSLPFGDFMKVYTELHGSIDLAHLGFPSLSALHSHAGLRRAKRGRTTSLFLCEVDEAQAAAGKAAAEKAPAVKAAPEAVAPAEEEETPAAPAAEEDRGRFLWWSVSQDTEKQTLVRNALARMCAGADGQRVPMAKFGAELRKLGIKIDGLKEFLCSDPLLSCSAQDGSKKWYVCFNKEPATACRTKQSDSGDDGEAEHSTTCDSPPLEPAKGFHAEGAGSLPVLVRELEAMLDVGARYVLEPKDVAESHDVASSDSLSIHLAKQLPMSIPPGFTHVSGIESSSTCRDFFEDVPLENSVDVTVFLFLSLFVGQCLEVTLVHICRFRD